MENPNLLPSEANQVKEEDMDIMIMSDVNEMTKQFLKENVIIWYDPNAHSTIYSTYINELNKTYEVRVFVSWKEASDHLKNETQLSSCQVITSGTDGELFVKEVSHLPYISSIYVFDSNIDCCQTWERPYRNKVKSTENNFECLLKKIKKIKPSLRVDLPSFAPIFDDRDLSKMNYLHFYLKGLISFKNRDQARKDFLNLAKKLYVKDANIDEFEMNYNQYDMNSILHWYTKESFLYKLANNCLRMAKSDSILYSRLVLKDLETAIKDKYNQKSYKFSGLLYRAAYLADSEWIKLQENTNQDIEMHGFLSASKVKDTAILFCQEDREKKAMITIIVPDFPEKGKQGFAEMREHSDFPDEEEVLFNVRSRFRVLEASWEEIDGFMIRHLVLLYNAQVMKRFTTDHDPSFEVQININQLTECQGCKKKIDIVHEPAIGVNICNDNEYFCKECMQQPALTNKLVLLCLSPAAQGLLSSSAKHLMKNVMIEGVVMQHQDNFNIPFYGYACSICKEKNPISCYRCLTCKNSRMVCCNKCFHSQVKNTCLGKSHFMILEGYPFRFWCEKLSENEVTHLNYQKEEMKSVPADHRFQQGMIFCQAHQYEESIEYFEKYLKKNGNAKNFDTVICYFKLGDAYKGAGRYQKAIECYSSCLESSKEVLREKDLMCNLYQNLGDSHKCLGQYKKAIECYSEGLKIGKVIFGDRHPLLANISNSLGEAYRCSGNYQKARDLISESLKIFKEVLGDKHPTTATCYYNLGEVCTELGEYLEAKDWYSKSLENYKVVFGDLNPNVANSYNNIGKACLNLGKNQEAVENYLKALEITKQMSGNKHSATATFYNNLGDAYMKLGEYQRAMEFFSCSLQMYKLEFGDKHPKTAACYNNLGEACRNLGEVEKAIKYHSKSLEISEAVHGNRHSETAGSYNNLGVAYMNLGKNYKAKEYFYKSLRIYKTVLGDNHDKTATSYNNLGEAYANLKDHQRAIEYHNKSLEINKIMFGDKHPSTAVSYNNLGMAYVDAGKYREAIDYISKCLEISKKVLGDKHPNIAIYYNNFAVAHMHLRQYQIGSEYYSKSLEIYKTEFGERHPKTADAYNSLGSAHVYLKDFQKALQNYSKCLAIKKVVFGENDSGTISCSQIVAGLQQINNRNYYY